MVSSRGKSIIILPKSFWKRSTKREFIRRFLTAFRTMKYFMQASSNITGRKMVRIFGLHQNNRYISQSLSRTIGTIRYVVSFLVRSDDPKQMERGPIKSRPDYHQTTRAIVSMHKEAGQFKNQKDVTMIARIWTQRSSTGLYGSHTIGNDTSRWT